MPRKYVRRRRRPTRKGKGAASKGWVRRFVTSHSDHKYFNVSNLLSVSDQYQVTDITAIAIGTTDTTRIGDDLVLKNIRLRFSVIGADATNQVRVILFQTRDRFTTTPGGGVVLNTAYDVTAYAPLAPYEYDGRGRYKVLFDKTVNTSANGMDARSFTCNVYQRKLARKHIRFYGSSTVDKEGGIYLMVCSDSAAVSHPTVRFAGQIDFTG